jgi:hypothetical protein
MSWSQTFRSEVIYGLEITLFENWPFCGLAFVPDSLIDFDRDDVGSLPAKVISRF